MLLLKATLTCNKVHRDTSEMLQEVTSSENAFYSHVVVVAHDLSDCLKGTQLVVAHARQGITASLVTMLFPKDRLAIRAEHIDDDVNTTK